MAKVDWIDLCSSDDEDAINILESPAIAYNSKNSDATLAESSGTALHRDKRQRVEHNAANEVTHVSDTVVASSEQQEVEASISGEASSPVLSEEQERVLQCVKEGKNIFFTGNAGTGKSFLLNRIIAELKSTYDEDFLSSVAICASTGIAATHVGGTTLHSAFGIGRPTSVADFDKAWKREYRDKIRIWKVLLVDEVSMVSGEMLENLEKITRAIRGSQAPFGGLQVVLCGDYFQLPPITDKFHPSMKADSFLNRGFTFQSPAWKRCQFHQFVLTKVFRQRDMSFVRILEAVRYNENAASALSDLMQHCARPLPAKGGIEPTSLFSRNADVNDLNEQKLRALPGEEEIFGAVDGVDPINAKQEGTRFLEEKLWRAEFFRDCLAPKQLSLKVGAQVMLLKNLDLQSAQMLVNGSRGVVVRFENLETVLGKEFPGRPKSAWEDKWKGKNLPVVRFLNGREMIVTPDKFTAELPATGTCKRLQVPLRLAWAITIHKSQGMTLEYVKVSLCNIFAPGQAYVALSRACSLEGLEVVDYSPGCVKTSAVVKKFHTCLMDGEEFEDNSWVNLMRLPGGSTPEQQCQTSQPSPSSQSNASRKYGNTCYRCGRPGHWARDCPNQR